MSFLDHKNFSPPSRIIEENGLEDTDMYGPKAFELTVGKVSDHLQNEHFESHEQL